MSEVKAKDNQKSESKPTGKPKSIVLEYFEGAVVTLIMAIFGMTFIIQAVTVPTGSMQNTILIGDYLLVNRFIFNAGGDPVWFLPQREIKRADIIVFKYPGNKVRPEDDASRGIVPYQINYVKRVIGLPGETVEFRNNQVYINGKLLPENRATGSAPTPGAALEIKEVLPKVPGATYTVFYSPETMEFVDDGYNINTEQFNFGVINKPMIVPEDSFFVMGDARDNSEDSRVWGFVPRSLIIGRAMLVYWSCDRATVEGKAMGCLTNPRLSRIGTFIK